MYIVLTAEYWCFCSLCTTGVVRLHINNWLEVSFCLPHKIHRIGGNYIPPEALERSLKAIRCVFTFYVQYAFFAFFKTLFGLYFTRIIYFTSSISVEWLVHNKSEGRQWILHGSVWLETFGNTPINSFCVTDNFYYRLCFYTIFKVIFRYYM